MNRRGVLRTAVLGGLAAIGTQAIGCLVGFARPTRDRERWVFVGHPSELTVGKPVYVASGRFFVSRVPEGVLAFSDRCTHLGCGVLWRPAEPSEDELGAQGRFNCPCHGAIYDRYGRVQAGPAPRPLDLVAISLEGSALIVDTRNVTRRTAYAPEQALPV